MTCADAEHINQDGRRAGARNGRNEEMLDDDISLVSDGRQNRLAEPALTVMILNHDDASTALLRVRHDRLAVQRLDGERIQHASVDAGLGQLSGGVQCLVQRNAGADQQHLILARLLHHLRLARGELLLVAVNHRRVGTRGSDEAHALGVGSELHRAFRADSVGWIKHGGPGDGAEQRNVLQSHLTRPVLADADAAVRPDEVHVRLADGAHADLIEGAREERGERGHEGDGAVAASGADGDSDEILLGDEALDVPLGERFLQLVGERRVLRVTIEGDDARVVNGDLGQRRSVRQSRGDLFAHLVGRRRCKLNVRDGHDGSVVDRCRWCQRQLAFVLDQRLQVLHDTFGGITKRLSMPVLHVLDVREEFSLEGFGDDGRRSSLCLLRLEERAAQLLHIMSVDDNRVEAEGVQALAVSFHLMLERRRLRLPQAVHIEDDAQVVEFVVPGEVERFPDGSFGRFAIADENVSSRMEIN